MRGGIRGALVAALLLVGLGGTLGPALADAFSLPGLEADSEAYARSLTSRNPAGGTPQARIRAEQQAAAALRKRDWAAAVMAWEARIALGEAAPGQWLALAQAEMYRTPPDAAHALQAAWRAFAATDAGAAQIPALTVMADALAASDRPARAIAALQAATDLAPDDARLGRLLADAQRAAGLVVRRLRTEPEAEPPRACFDFTVAPQRGGDFHPQDWVALDPPTPGAAVTREGDQICVSGLPSGRTTRLTFRAGMPGMDGVSLHKDLTLAVAIGDRAPWVVFDSRFFVLPHGQTQTISLTTVNLSAVKLVLARLTERNVLPFIRNNRLGEPVETYASDDIAERSGSIVWEGRASIPNWKPNETARTALPLPEALAGAGPGLYALTARAGDGTPGDAAAVQMILRTDLAPTVWRGADGLTVQVRAFSDALPRRNARLALIAENNDVLAEETTDANGVARFAAPLLRGEGPRAARAIHVFGPDASGSGGDFTTIDLDRAAFDLSDRGVSGQPNPGPLDAFAWTDRGIYRPGETVQFMALLRDAAGQPKDLPAHLIVRKPNGLVFSDTVPLRGADASIYAPVLLSASAPAGQWSAEIRVDPAAPPIRRAEFRVDAFTPDRMAVDFGPIAGPITPGQPSTLPVAARFLYGAPGAGLSGKGSLRLDIDPAPFPALAGFAIGLEGEAYAPDNRTLDLPDTDAQGRTTLTIALPRAPDSTRALKAAIDVSVDDPSGHAAHASAEIPVRPGGDLIGVKPLFGGGSVDAGTEAAFDIAAVSPNGERVAIPARLRLVREQPDWRLAVSGGLARYEIVWRDEPLETQSIEVPAAGAFRFARRLDFGRYRLEVTQAGDGLAATSVRFRSGWVASDSPDIPDQVDVSADRAVHAAGETAHIHIAPPFAGEATLLVLTDRVQEVRSLSIAAKGADVDVPVSADWGPGAYIAVHLFAPAKDAPTKGDRPGRPSRAIGLVWVGLNPAPRTLPVSMDLPDKLAPRAKAIVPVHTAPGAWVTLAAVDEGILRLTNFASPDPVSHFLGRRTLGIDIRDDWGRLIAPGEGSPTVLRQGGDEGSAALPEILQKTVSLFAAPVQADGEGVARIPLDLPDFAGQVRLMAVAWSGNRLGAAHADALLRDPLIAEPLLPRFLAPGDESRLAVLMQNLELPPGEAAVDVTVDGPLRLTGPAHLAATLAAGAQATPVTTLAATGAGRGVIRLDVAGPGGFHVHRETAILVRPARGPTTLVAAGEIPPDAEATLDPGADRFLAGAWRATASFGGAVRYDAAALVQALGSYPLNCLEQAVSRGFPLALLSDGPVAGEDRAGRLQSAVGSALDRQRFDGGFALWSASGEAEPWLSLYATEFLLRARAAGAAVPAQALKDALKFIADEADSTTDSPEDYAAQAYRLYVLALADQGRPGAARVLAERADKLPTPLARAQLAAALARAHEGQRAEALFAAALDAPGRKPWAFDYGTALRDQAVIALLLKESGLLPGRLAPLLASLPGGDLQPSALSTQEQAWAAAAAAVLSRGARPVRVAVQGKALDIGPLVAVSLVSAETVRNLDDLPVWRTVSATGVPSTPLPAARSGMRVTRRFLSLDGKPVGFDHLKQNAVFILLFEGRAEDGQAHRAMLLDGLPAGWEITGRLNAGDVPGMAWLGKLSETESQPAADDRYAAVLDLTPDHPDFRVAAQVRAVTPGNFELPGTELSDMYRPGVFARQATARIAVQSNE